MTQPVPATPTPGGGGAGPADGGKEDANSKLKGVDVLLLGLGLVSALTGLIYIGRVHAERCSTRTTTTAVTAADPARQVSGKKETVTTCEPPKITAGYPEAALLVGLVLVVPAVSRRVAAGFELEALGNKLKKTRPAALARGVNAKSAEEAENDPAV